jgi:DNA-directed RNA polymerase subunit beta'
VDAAEPITDGPSNPHDILDIFFNIHKEKEGIKEAALISLQKVQEFLVNEVQTSTSPRAWIFPISTLKLWSSK